MAANTVKVFRTLLILVLVLCIPVFLLSSNLRWAVNSVRLYQTGFDRFAVSETTGLSDSDLLVVAREMVHYFNSGEEPIRVTIRDPGGDELFSEREIVHLRDVKAVIRLCYCVQIGALACIAAAVAIGFAGWKRRFLPALFRGALGGGVLTVAMLVLLGLGALVSFDWLFVGFHHLFFAADTWIFDPASDYLIMMFPLAFFFNVALAVVFASIAEALILAGFGWFLLRRRKKASG